MQTVLFLQEIFFDRNLIEKCFRVDAVYKLIYVNKRIRFVTQLVGTFCYVESIRRRPLGATFSKTIKYFNVSK